MIQGGAIINKFIGFIRTTLAILSCLLLAFGVYAWITGLTISDSEWLPIMLSSSLNLFLLFAYWALGSGFIKTTDIPENKIVRVLAKVGFGGNIALFIICIMIVGGFGIIP